MDTGKGFTGSDGELWLQSVVRFKKGLEKLTDKKSVEGLVKAVVRRVSSVTVVPAGVCLGNGLYKAASLMCFPEEGSLILTVESRVLDELDRSDPGQEFL